MAQDLLDQQEDKVIREIREREDLQDREDHAEEMEFQ